MILRRLSELQSGAQTWFLVLLKDYKLNYFPSNVEVLSVLLSLIYRSLNTLTSSFIFS